MLNTVKWNGASHDNLLTAWRISTTTEERVEKLLEPDVVLLIGLLEGLAAGSRRTGDEYDNIRKSCNMYKTDILLVLTWN